MPTAKKSGRKTRNKMTRRPTARKKKTTRTAVSRKKTAARRKTTARKTKVKKKKIAARKKTPARKKTTRKKIAAKTKKAAPRKKTTARKKPAVRKTARRRATNSAQGLLYGPTQEFAPYAPRRGEDYMSEAQLKHFRAILHAWKRQLMEEVDRTVHHMKDEAANFPDPNDRATQESEFSLELRTRDRERKLLRKIHAAMQRMEDGTYGFCVETGEEIGLRRLEARPVATLTLEAQERREVAERQYRDDR